MNNKIIDRLTYYYLLLRPGTSMSTILAGLGGIAYACRFNSCISSDSILAVLGITLAHLSVNALNDIQDYLSGLDKETQRTPFSGGSKILVEGKVSVMEALALFLITFLSAASIGLYLSLLYGFFVLVLVIAGALIIVLYDPFLLRLGLGEFGVYLKGVLVFLGCFYIASKNVSIDAALTLGSIYGLFSVIALYINGIPDIEADMKYGRRTLTMLFRDKLWIGYVLLLLLYIMFLTLSLISNTLSVIGIIAVLSTLPFALRVTRILRGGIRHNFLEILMLNSKFSKSTLLLLTIVIGLESVCRVY